MKKILILAFACLAGAANAQWFTSIGSVGVPDNNAAGVNVTILVSGVGNSLTDINFGTVIEHTWQGDFVFTLTSPGGGASATILVRPGTAGGAGFGYSSDNFGNPVDPTNPANWFILDDSAASLYDEPAVPVPGIPNVTGSWLPSTGLNATFAGIDPNGVWTANFSDNAGGDVGSVEMAGVEIRAVPEPATMIALGLGLSALVARRRRKVA